MNRVRGEQRLTVAEAEYVFRPTHGALASIEGRLDVGLLELARRFINAKARQGDVAVILQECSRAAGKELALEAAFEFSMVNPAKANKCATALILERFGPEPEPVSGKAEATAG